MSKTFLRTVLAAFAAAGVAGAQTPPPRLTPTSTPPMPAAAPVQQVAFKVMPQPAPALPQFLTKVFDVTDLVCPPKDSPLAKPSDDTAMTAAATAYTKVRAEQLKKILRDTVNAGSWEENGGPGRMEYYPAGQSLVVNASVEVVVRVGECLESLRRLNAPQVFVEMMLLSVSSEHPAMKKLFGKKREAALTKEELTKLLRELKTAGALDVLSRPQLMLTDRQTGFFQTGQQFPRLTGSTPADKGTPGLQQVEYIPTGTVVRLTPECLGDGKPTRMRLEVSLTEPCPHLIDLGNGIKAQPIDCQAIEATVEVPDGGTMALNVGTRKVEQRVEHKVPVLGDLPFVGRLFRNVGIGHERRDTVVVFTATRVNSEQQLRTLTAAAQVVPPMAAPPAVMPLATVREFGRTQRPVSLKEAFEIALEQGNVRPVPMCAPVAPPMVPQAVERVGKIVIVGNAVTMDRVILKQLDGLKPGQILEYPRIEEARKNLIRLQIFDNDPPPTVEVLPGELGRPFRDIRVTVKEEARTGHVHFRSGVNSNAGLDGPLTVTQGAPVATPPVMPVLPRTVAPVAVPPMTVAPIAAPPVPHYVEGRFLPPPVAIRPVIHAAVQGTTYHTPDRSAAVPQAMWLPNQVTPIPMPIHNPFLPLLPVVDGVIVSRLGTAVPGTGFHFNTAGAYGPERIGVDSHLIPASGSVPVTGRIAGAGHGGIPAGDETAALLKAYRAACAAGKKDEASRLALQLLAKDPTCFGRDR